MEEPLLPEYAFIPDAKHPFIAAVCGLQAGH